MDPRIFGLQIGRWKDNRNWYDKESEWFEKNKNRIEKDPQLTIYPKVFVLPRKTHINIRLLSKMSLFCVRKRR